MNRDNEISQPISIHSKCADMQEEFDYEKKTKTK